MARSFNSLDQVCDAAIDAAAAKIILMDYVAPVVEDILRKHIREDVYGAYSPTQYVRRGSLTGTITSKMIADNELLVTATSQPNAPAHGWASSGEGAFLYMLEVGDLGWWRKGFPRPAIANAQKEVDESAAVERAKKAGIKRVMSN